MAQKTLQLAQHPDYWVGQEHALFPKSLEQALDDGPKRFVADTDRRTAWFADRSHYFPELMLVGCLAYLEGELRPGWIAKYGGKRRRELYVLRLVRNAIVHTAGDLKGLDAFKKRVDARKGRPPDITQYVRRFCADLRNRRTRPDLRGRRAEVYMVVDRSGIVRLNDKAFFHLRILTIEVLGNAGRLRSG